MKTKIIPFDAKMAKKIQDGEIKGRIVTKVGGAARIVCFDKKTDTRHPLVVLIHDLLDPDIESVGCYTTKGEVVGDKIYNLCIELPEEAPKHKFKPFDKVLVRNSVNGGDAIWEPQFYSMSQMYHGELIHKMMDGYEYDQVIPYEGNEHLVGTSDKPKLE